MGPALDHHRHQPRRPGARPHPADERALSLLPPRRLARRAAQGAGGVGPAAAARRGAGRHPPGLRLRARAARHPQVDRQQRRDRRDLGAVAGRARAAARRAQRALPAGAGRNGRFPRELPAPRLAAAAEPHAKWWEARIARQREIDASIAKAADVELSLRPALRGHGARARRRAVHGRSLSPHRVVPADAAALFDEADDCSDGRRSRRRCRSRADRLRRDDPRQSARRRRARSRRSATRIAFTSSRPGPAPRASAPRGASSKARAAPSAAPPSCSGRSSARSAAATSSPPRARRRRRASTC